MHMASDPNSTSTSSLQQISSIWTPRQWASERLNRIIADARTVLDVAYCSIIETTDQSGLLLPEDADDPLAVLTTAVSSEEDVLVVADAAIHAVLQQHPLVVISPGIRLYARVRLYRSGVPTGWLVVADCSVRELTRKDVRFIELLAQEVELEFDRQESEARMPPTISEQGGYLRLAAFLEQVQAFLEKSSRVTSLLLKLIPDGSGIHLDHDSLAQLRAEIAKAFAGSAIVICKMTHENILLAIDERVMNSFANAYILRKTVEACLRNRILQGRRVEIIFGRIVSTGIRSAFSVSNKYNKLLTFRFMDETGEPIRMHDLTQDDITFQNLSSFNLDLSNNEVICSEVIDLETKEVEIHKISWSREFHSANREFDLLKSSEQERLVDYTIEMLRVAAAKTRESTAKVSIDILMPALLSSRFMAVLQHYFDTEQLEASRTILSVDAFSFEKYHLSIKKFIDCVLDRRERPLLALNTFSTMVRHIPFYVTEELSYCFAYTPLLLTPPYHEDDKIRIRRLLLECAIADVDCIAMGHGTAEELQMLAELGTRFSIRR
jgi:hypothetical protein